jgi:uncharacterized membrane protein
MQLVAHAQCHKQHSRKRGGGCSVVCVCVLRCVRMRKSVDGVYLVVDSVESFVQPVYKISKKFLGIMLLVPTKVRGLPPDFLFELVGCHWAITLSPHCLSVCWIHESRSTSETVSTVVPTHMANKHCTVRGSHRRRQSLRVECKRTVILRTIEPSDCCPPLP